MGRFSQIAPRHGSLKPRHARPAKTADPFYLSPAWRALASAIKRQRGYVCEQCGADKSADRRACHADHVVEIGDGGAALDPLNIRVLCQRCHNAKTRAVAARR